MSMSSHQSPVMGTDTWLTPPEIISALGEFDLDPCAAPSPRPWPTAKRHIELPDDGLRAEWSGRVWCNPPFGRAASAWLGRMAQHGNGIALIPARTETEMFFRHVWRAADAVLFLRGRPHFHRPSGERAPFNSGAPICLVAYGLANVAALERSGLGHVAPIIVAAPQPQPQPVVEPVLPTITAEEAREFQRWKGMDGATAYHLIERHADGWADVGVMMNAWLEANAAKPPAEPEKNCWTCKHASKDAGAAPCNGCGVAEAWDKWEPAAPTQGHGPGVAP